MVETLKDVTGRNGNLSKKANETLNSWREWIKESFESAKEYFAQKMGSYLHEEWRKTRLREDWSYEPRMKDGVDIANTSFEDLPSKWKYENLEAARVVVGLVYEKVVNWEEITSEMIEEMSSIVHERWLERNDWVYDAQYWNPVLAQPYEALPEEEKAKDRAQIEAAIKIIKAEKVKGRH